MHITPAVGCVTPPASQTNPFHHPFHYLHLVLGRSLISYLLRMKINCTLTLSHLISHGAASLTLPCAVGY